MLRVSGSGFRGLGFRVTCRVWGSGFWGSGFHALQPEHRSLECGLHSMIAILHGSKSVAVAMAPGKIYATK